MGEVKVDIGDARIVTVTEVVTETETVEIIRYITLDHDWDENTGVLTLTEVEENE